MSVTYRLVLYEQIQQPIFSVSCFLPQMYLQALKCIIGILYFYSKTNQMHQCINFISFWNDTLHVSDGLSVHHQEFKTVHTATGICQTDTADCLLTDSSICLVAVSTVLNCWWWTERPSETCRVSFQNKINLIRTATDVCQTDTAVCLLADSSICLVAVCTVLNCDDGRKDRPKHVECHSKIK